MQSIKKLFAYDSPCLTTGGVCANHKIYNPRYPRVITGTKYWINVYSFPSCESKRNEPPHDKTSKMAVRPAKTQISLGIRPVWSESSMSAWRKLGSLATHWAHSDAKTRIRLGGCPGWSESSLGAQSFCWFCHDAAQICTYTCTNIYSLFMRPNFHTHAHARAAVFRC